MLTEVLSLKEVGLIDVVSFISRSNAQFDVRVSVEPQHSILAGLVRYEDHVVVMTVLLHATLFFDLYMQSRISDEMLFANANNEPRRLSTFAIARFED